MPAKHTFCPTREFHPESATIHVLAMEGDSEPLLLPRVLQKLAVPEITMLTVQCGTDERSRTTRIEVRFRATTSRAELTSLKMEKIVSIRKVVLLPQADNPWREADPRAPTGLDCPSRLA